MRTLTRVFAVVVLLSGFVHCATEEASLEPVPSGPSDVREITSKNYNELVGLAEGSKGAWIEFYAPWCGYCKRIIGDWEKLATALKGEAPVAKIDATVEKDISELLGVRGFPTIYFVKNGRGYVYDGERDHKVMEQWFRDSAFEKVTSFPFPKIPETDVTFSGVDGVIAAHTDDEIDDALYRAGPEKVVAFLTCNGALKVCQQVLSLFKKLSTNPEYRIVFTDARLIKDNFVSTRLFGPGGRSTLFGGIVKGNTMYRFDPTFREKDVVKAFTTGTTAEVVPFPARTSALDKFLVNASKNYDMLYEDYLTMMEYKKGILAAVSSTFLILGFAIGYLVRGAANDAKVDSKKKKN